MTQMQERSSEDARSIQVNEVRDRSNGDLRWVGPALVVDGLNGFYAVGPTRVIVDKGSQFVNFDDLMLMPPPS